MHINQFNVLFTKLGLILAIVSGGTGWLVVFHTIILTLAVAVYFYDLAKIKNQ